MSGQPNKRTKFSKIWYPSPGLTALAKEKKLRSKKESDSSKYEMLKKSTGLPDYTDVAYREALTRLRYLLNDSYVPARTNYAVGGFYKQEGSDEEGSPTAMDKISSTRMSTFRRPLLPFRLPRKFQPSSQYYVGDDNLDSVSQNSPELVAFIERQEEYIDQLEKEAQYCRDELSHLLGKVKELISENESLQDQQKRGLMKVMFESVEEDRMNSFQSPRKHRKAIEGPTIVFESRISELEAQLTQTRMDLRKAQEEAETYKKKLEDSHPSSINYDFYKQIENLQREKKDLNESLAKLQASINQIREKELDASKKVQRTLDVMDKTQFEKQQAEMEVYRLKSELELQHDKLLEVLSEQTRKVADERSQAEKRYHQHLERLNNELAETRDALAKMRMDLEKHQRSEEDLKRDLNSKNLTIESIKKELNNKIASLQKELSTSLAERDSFEQELNTNKTSSERSERLSKQESSRLQIEISALKKRLDDGDANLIHSRRENLKLLEKISDLEKELTLYKIKLGEQKDPIEDEEQKARESIMNSRISEIEAKHVEKVSDLEGLIKNQSEMMAQLKAQCQSLTQKLEESTARHKQEMGNLQSRLNNLNSKMNSNLNTSHQWNSDDISKEPETVINRYHNLTEGNNYSGGSSDPVNFNQKFLNEESRNLEFDHGLSKQSSSSQDVTYGLLSGNGDASTIVANSGDIDGVSGNGISGTNADTGKLEEKNLLYENKNNNEYYNYYQGEVLPPNSNYQNQNYLDQTPASYQQHMSFDDQKQPLDSSYQEQLSSHQEQSLPHGLKSFQDQPKFVSQESTLLTQKSTVDEPYNQSVTNVTHHTVPLEPSEVAISEPKPTPPEPAKPTGSQRFQRAAEMSRLSAKSDDSPRKLTSFTRTRNAQMSRTQSKPPPRFK